MRQQPQICKGVSQEVDVIGQEAQQVDGQHPVNDSESVLMVAALAAGTAPWLAKNAQHLAVAVEK